MTKIFFLIVSLLTISAHAQQQQQQDEAQVIQVSGPAFFCPSNEVVEEIKIEARNQGVSQAQVARAVRTLQQDCYDKTKTPSERN